MCACEGGIWEVEAHKFDTDEGADVTFLYLAMCYVQKHD